jgi:cytochrome b
VRVLALTIGATLVTVLLLGAGPALAAARRDFGAAVDRAVGALGTRSRRLHTTLVIAEIALTVVLLAAAGCCEQRKTKHLFFRLVVGAAPRSPSAPQPPVA